MTLTSGSSGRLVAFASLSALLLLGACVPAAPDNDEFKKFNATTTVMGQVQEAGVLRVGLPIDRPAFATASSACTPSVPCEGVEGFTYELAQEVAEALKVDMAVYAVPNDELIGLVEADGADLAFPMIPITEELVRKSSFTDPFIVGHQRLMVGGALLSAAPSQDEGLTVANLTRFLPTSDPPVEFCEFIYPDVGVPLSELAEGLGAIPVDDPGGCGALFLKGEIVGAVGHDLALAGILPFLEGTCGEGGCPGVPPFPRFQEEQLSTEGYGALVPSGEATWRDFVTQVLEESQQEGRWAELYETWLQPLLGGEVLSPPGMSVEEAAALFPADL